MESLTNERKKGTTMYDEITLHPTRAEAMHRGWFPRVPESRRHDFDIGHVEAHLLIEYNDYAGRIIGYGIKDVSDADFDEILAGAIRYAESVGSHARKFNTIRV